MKTIETPKTANFGGIIENLEIYDSREVIEVGYPDSDHRSQLIKKDGSLPFFIPFTKDTLEYSAKNVEKEGLGSYFNVEITGNVPKVRETASERIDNLMKKRFVVLCTLKAGGTLILGDPDKPLTLTADQAVSGDFKANSYRLKLSGISLGLPPFLKK